MSTEVWFRNPDLYVRECAEMGAFNWAWDRGYLVKKRIDPERFAGLHVPAVSEYRMLLVGDQGTAEITRSHPVTSPRAVYPTWDYEMDTIAALEEMLAVPLSELARYTSEKLPADERAVSGQEHRVVIINAPPANAGMGKKFFLTLHDLQGDYPEAIVHVHNLYGYNAAFGLGFRSVDIDPRTSAKKGKVVLPNGREMVWENTASVQQWVHVIGYSVPDLEVPRNRCMFNMASAQWAGEHFAEQVKFKTRGGSPVDPHIPDAEVKSQTTISSKSQNLVGTVGDKVICDRCSLSSTCKFFRVGEVCAIPGTEQAELAQAWGTRDSDAILDGLARLMKLDSDRLERGADDERRLHEVGLSEGLDPEVTKLSSALFDRGVKLARLIDPQRFPSGTRVGININTPQQPELTPTQSIAAQLMALAEREGLPAAALADPDVVKMLLKKQGQLAAPGAGEPDVTEAEVVD